MVKSVTHRLTCLVAGKDAIAGKREKAHDEGRCIGQSKAAVGFQRHQVFGFRRQSDVGLPAFQELPTAGGQGSSLGVDRVTMRMCPTAAIGVIHGESGRLTWLLLRQNTGARAYGMRLQIFRSHVGRPLGMRRGSGWAGDPEAVLRRHLPVKESARDAKIKPDRRRIHPNDLLGRIGDFPRVLLSCRQGRQPRYRRLDRRPDRRSVANRAILEPGTSDKHEGPA